jgi:hypothetical protein
MDLREGVLALSGGYIWIVGKSRLNTTNKNLVIWLGSVLKPVEVSAEK